MTLRNTSGSNGKKLVCVVGGPYDGCRMWIPYTGTLAFFAKGLFGKYDHRGHWVSHS